jgi:hypothetical protein
VVVAIFALSNGDRKVTSFGFFGSRQKRSQNYSSTTRRLTFQPLESRELMAGIPQLSSLPGAAKAIYLDFDGDFQAVWNRTDSNQQYTNVNVGEFNIDNSPGISDSEEAAIRKIWETVADDFAPFNVNVTTVAPPSFANNVALRVVMAGTSNATLRNNVGQTINIPIRDVFISNNNGTMVDTSGYAAINSYTNNEPNVVYVFAKYMSTWGTTDSEGHFRDLRGMIATTASHEAGHAFGLVHEGNYDVGTNITTPIMGSNTQGDRSIWSLYTSGQTTFDTKARLTTLLGARPDDYTSSLSSATQFPLTYNPIFGVTGTVKGVIGTTGDLDLFRLTTNAANTYKFTVSVPQFGDLDSRLVLYMVRGFGPGTEYLQEVITVDPSIPSTQPFSGLGASLTVQLPVGKWAIGVKSHGGYGDIGGYSLTVGIPSTGMKLDPTGGVLTTFAAGQGSNSLPAQKGSTTLGIMSGGAGGGLNQNIAQSLAAARLAVQDQISSEKSRKKDELAALDQLFAAWPSRLGGVL